MKFRSLKWQFRLTVKVMLALAAILFAGVLFGQTAGRFPHQDFETRTDFNAAHHLNKTTNFLVGAGLHFSGDQGHVVYREFSTGLAYRWDGYLTFEPYYQYSFSDEPAGRFQSENRLAFAAIVGRTWKHWKASDRNLGERRYFGNKRAWRYRNRLEFLHPVRIKHRILSVFVWDEVSYSSRARRWYRNRAALGAGRKLSGSMSVQVYYLHQNDGFSRPGDLDGIEMTVSTDF